MNKVKIKDIVDIYNGSTPSTSVSENFDGHISWITPKDISDQKTKYIYRGERNITEKGLNSIGGNLLPKGTILFSSRAPIGLMSICTKETSTNQGFKNMVCKKDKIDNEYLYYLLKTQISKIQELGTGTTFKEVSKTTIEGFELYIEEDLPTQQKIAAVLSALDDKIEVNNKINAELEAMAKTLYDYWFVQFEFPNAEGKPYKSSGGKMEYNSILKREIPEGWEVNDLENILIEFTKGITSTYVEKSNLINLNQKVNKGSFLDRQYFKYLDESIEVPISKYAKKGDILINSLGQGTLGRVHYFIDPDENIVVDQHLFILRSNNRKVTSSYLYNTLSSKAYQLQIERQITGSTGMQMLNASNLKDLPILTPVLSVCNEYEDLVSNFYDRISINEKQNQELAQLRDWLLPMLMNGQVTVE